MRGRLRRHLQGGAACRERPALERDYIAALATRFAQDANHDLHVLQSELQRPSRLLLAISSICPHIFYQRVGDFNDSAIANQRAILADQAHFRSQRIEGQPSMYNGMYYTHNQQSTFISRDATVSTSIEGAA